jgi:DnaD/phage-associated family protein
MEKQGITIEQAELRKLLAAASGDAALLFLHIQNGGDLANGETVLQMTKSRIECAAATLRQLGLWQEERKIIPLGERPAYSESDVLSAMNKDGNFRLLYGEVQRLLGRAMNTEELKILLSFDRYLGLPCEVISLLVSYCKDKARQKGNLRNPSLRTIEKEAYRWAEMGIDTPEEAVAFIQKQNLKNTRLSKLMEILQIRGRSLTAAEEKYALSWLEMGVSNEVLAMAYERTCINTGGMRWPYMNKILTRWHEAGYKTAEQVLGGDRKDAAAQRKLDSDEQAAIARMMQEV